MSERTYTKEEVLKLIPFAKNYANRYVKKPEELLEKFEKTMTPAPDHMVLLTTCEGNMEKKNWVTLRVKGYLEPDGKTNDQIQGPIEFSRMQGDNHLDFLKEGELYTITIKKV